VAVYVGPGDLHDDDALFRASAHINPNYFSNSTVKYFLEIYSTDEFVNYYSTNNPRTACIGAVAIMVFTSLLFFFYDFFVRKEFHSKKNLLESKRQFVRFVSHEVRTPLNTVCMGLSLLQDDFATVQGLRRDASGKLSSNNAGKSNDTNKEQFEEWLNLSNLVYRNAEAAVSVLNDLLNYDKIQTGTLTLELSLIPIRSALEKTVSDFKIDSMEKKVKLEIDFSPLVKKKKDKDIEEAGARMSRLPQGVKDCRMMIVGDNVRIAQVLRNLISNGLKFSKDKGKNNQSSTVDEGSVQIMFSDCILLSCCCRQSDDTSF
jgi:signal transduction histidine kinase